MSLVDASSIFKSFQLVPGSCFNHPSFRAVLQERTENHNLRNFYLQDQFIYYFILALFGISLCADFRGVATGCNDGAS